MRVPGQYYVYILHCNNNSYYVGVTNDLDRRIYEHQTGFNINCYTYDKRPLTLKYSELFIQIDQALEREKQLKRWTKRKKEALINGEVSLLKKYASGKRLDK